MLRAFVALLIASLAWTAPAHAEKRLALLIGNQAYSAEIGKLANPHNDIALLERTLKALQFEVATVRDANLGGMHQAVNAYARRVKAAGPGAIAFFYYAGHGASDAGTNYLIPVDVKSAEEGDLWDVSLRLTEVTRKLKAEAGNATHFVVFDACRNTLKLRAAGTRALVQSRGFVPVAQESGMLVAYATAEGELASDVGAAAGPYSSVLAEEIVKPGVESVEMFRRVQRRVRATIRQEPYLGFNALGDVYLAGLAPDPPKAPPTPPTAPARLSEAAEAWDRTKDTSSFAALEAFIRRFGDTYYGDLAKVRLGELKQAEAKQAADATKKRADEDARAKADAERQRLAMLQQEEERKRAEAKRKADEEAARRDTALLVKPGSGVGFRDCADCPEMVVVPAGSFMMGSPESENGRGGNEGPQRKVTIARPFAVGKYEVTFAEWDACRATGACKHSPGDEGWGRGKRPVINVSWNDITKEYLPWLSRKTDKAYRLLTEAEWEYAARAGSTTAFWWGSSISTVQPNSGPQGQYTVPVDGFAANPWGLYNMHGNVWEWVDDCWTANYQGAPTDGTASTTGDCGKRARRSGSRAIVPQYHRSASRDWNQLDFRGQFDGFRVGRTLD